MNQLFQTKSIEQLCLQAEQDKSLKRTLGAFDLTLLGIGAIVGTGIFVMTGRAAACNAGPAVSLSFALAGFVAALAALCYAEMASMIPVAGSAYTYAYATMGEVFAWMIGWDLLLEYMLAVPVISIGWAGYVGAFVEHVTGYALPKAWTSAPVVWDEAAKAFHSTGTYMNLPALVFVLLVTMAVALGVQASVRINAFIVALKLAVILLFIACASRFVRAENWVPFVPANEGVFGRFGWSGVFQGATSVFLAYIGFDALATTAQETRKPQRDLPIGILSSLVVCVILYILVSVVLTGVVPYTQLAVPHPIAVGIATTGMGWLETVVEVGAIAGLSSVGIVMLMAGTRILYAMAQDGLVPPVAKKIHPRLGTPLLATLCSGVLCALLSGFFPIEIFSELTSVGTLFAFLLVSAAVFILRFKRPDIQRVFTVPGGPFLVPGLSAAASLFLMYTASSQTVLRFVLWTGIGLVVYACYGWRHSKLRAAAQAAREEG